MRHTHLATAMALLAATVGFSASSHAAQPNAPVVEALHGTSGGMPARDKQSYWRPAVGRITVINTMGQPYKYDKQQGLGIYNPGSGAVGGKYTEWQAWAFTPKKDVTLTEIVEGITYDSAKDHKVTIGLYADKKDGSSPESQSVPGALLQQKTVTVTQAPGSCCAVVVDSIVGGYAAKKGQTYWVAAILPNKSEVATNDVWNFVTTGRTDRGALYDGTKWNAGGQSTTTAFAVYGK